MNDHDWEQAEFYCQIQHTGFQAECRDGDKSAGLTADQASAYKAAKDKARIFYQTRDGVPLSAAQLLAWFLKDTKTELMDYVSPELAAEAYDKGTASGPFRFLITFSPNTFHMNTTKGVKDLASLTLFVDYTVSPVRET